MSLRILLFWASAAAVVFPSLSYSQEAVTPAVQEHAQSPANSGEEFSSPHAEYFATFDTDGDGMISSNEGLQLPEQLTNSFGRRNSASFPLTLERFHHQIEYYKQLLERDLLRKQAKEKQVMRERAFNDYTRKLLKELHPEQVSKEKKIITLESSPHAPYFKHFDRDGNGIIEQEEKQNLPDEMQRWLASNNGVAWDIDGITIREFHDYWETQKQEWDRHMHETLENKRHGDYHAAYVRGEEKSASKANKPAEQKNVEASKTEPPKVKSAQTIVAQSDAKSIQVEVVMLRRTSDALPKRTLASEVKSGIEGAGQSLSAGLLPWLAKPGSEGIRLVDYIQAQSIDGQAIIVQRGGREPYVSGTTTMGSRGGAQAVAYSMHEVGTLVRVEPVAGKEDGKLALSVAFEKSYIDQPAKEVDEEDAEVATEQPEDLSKAEEGPAEPGMGRLSGTSSRARTAVAQGFGQPYAFNQPQAQPPAIATITAQGSLVQPAGEVGVLSEMAKQSGDVFEEVVILVQWN